MKDIVKRSILTVKPYLPGKPIDEVKRELGLKSVIKLASNESPYGPSPKVRKAIIDAAKDINRYPDGGCFSLRQALAKELDVFPSQLIFGNGSDEIIVMAVRAFAGEGDEVVMARPSFLIYEIASRIAGAKIKFVPLKNFRYDLERMEEAVSPRTKIIFIGNPDNPAGTYVTKKQVEDFLRKVRRNVIVFFDEAYFEFVKKSDYPDTIKLLRAHKNIVITRTFSKMYGLAGLRVGYGIADQQIVSILDRVREPFNINSMAQAAALACLRDKSYYEKNLNIIKKEREFLYENFRKMKLPFVDSVTNFILLNVRRNSFQVSQQLLKKGIIIRDMGFWGLDTYIRVTIGTPQENRKFIQALKEVL